MVKRTRYSSTRLKALRAKRSNRKKSVCNPVTKPVMNKQGGVYQTTTFELVRAKLVDLGTLPTGLCGTSCVSCKFFKRGSGKIGYCKHVLIQQPVTARMCCAAWRPYSGWLTPKVVN